MTQKIRPVILCGGSGTRLWPLSSARQPKQFQPLTSAHSMLKETALRFEASTDHSIAFTETLVIGSAKHREFLDADLPYATKILEPFGRNSAPAVCAACLVSQPDDIILILPADHSVLDVSRFHQAIALTASAAARDGKIVTFGIRPSYAATGYGYIRAADVDAEISPVEAFVEKPVQSEAEEYLATGGYYWNAGIFMFRASVMLKALVAFTPDIVTCVRDAIGENLNSQTIALDPRTFSKSPDISIDYAVMERAENIVVAPVEMGWSDVGGYKALHSLFASGETATASAGPVVLDAVSNAYVRSTGPRLYAKGIEELTVIATDDAVMIAPLGDDDAAKAFGSIERERPFTLGISERTKNDARERLISAFGVWAEKAWDDASGGFVEQLDLTGTPDTGADRRVRVQARQVFSFAKAVELGLLERSKGENLVASGLRYIDQKCRSEDGGFVHIIDPEGGVVDGQRDLYDHAFLILAGAASARVTGSELGRKIASDALNFVMERLPDRNGDGWYEGCPNRDIRRANPHMHLLEAALELQTVDNSDLPIGFANQIVSLFERKLFDARSDALVEVFKSDWTVPTAATDVEIEPGHHYEWSVLLALHQRLTGHDTLSWQRRLVAKADTVGIDQASGFAHNTVRVSGDITNSSRRLWPQMEMLRARLVHPSSAAPGAAEALYWAIVSRYFDGMPTGTWLDQTDADGRPTSEAIPASMLYHMVTSFGMLL